MTVASLPQRFTADDLLRLPDNNTMELVDGQIRRKTVSFLSSKTELRVALVLSSYADRTRAVEVLPATMGYRCFQALIDDPDRMRKPDVFGHQNRANQCAARPNPGYMPIVPDLAIEILSTNDVISNVNEKLQEYLLAGFPLVWIVDPELHTVTVYPNPGKPFIRSGDDELSAEYALPGFVCKVSDLFPPI